MCNRHYIIDRIQNDTINIMTDIIIIQNTMKTMSRFMTGFKMILCKKVQNTIKSILKQASHSQTKCSSLIAKCIESSNLIQITFKNAKSPKTTTKTLKLLRL